MFQTFKSGRGLGNGRFLMVGMTITLLSITLSLTALAAPSGGSFNCATATDVPEAECNALVDLYEATNTNGWTLHQNWLESTEVCTWQNVSCEGGHVTALFLYANNLYGQIPTSIGDLTYLEKLYMPQNQLSGSIPKELSELPNLEELDLYNNQLSGILPRFFDSATLRLLILGENSFLVRLPDDWGTMANLENLDLSDNFLIGDIPEPWTGMSSLKLFHFSDTYLCQHNTGDVNDWLDLVESLEVSGNMCAPSVSDLNARETVAYADQTGLYMVNIPLTNPTDPLARDAEAPQALTDANLVVELNPSVSLAATFPKAHLVDGNLNVWNFEGSEAETLGYVTLVLFSNNGEGLPDAAFQYTLTTIEKNVVEINTTAVILSGDDAPPTVYLPFVQVGK